MSSLLTYIDHLQRQWSDELAFYPISALEKAVRSNRIITCEENGESAGYLWHGSVRPGRDVVMYQACVDYESQRRHLGWGMVSGLITMAKAGGATGMRCRVASSNESNEFWRLIGFYCTKVSQGGVKRGRKINHWRTDIQKPLFRVDEEIPSTVPIDLRSYRKDKRNGVDMPNRWSRSHYDQSSISVL